MTDNINVAIKGDSTLLPQKRIIIDTDSGIDDIISIIVSLKHEKSKLEAITVVEGNVSLKQGLLNLCSLLDVSSLRNRKISIYPGCDKPIIQNFNKEKPYSLSSFHNLNAYSLHERNLITNHIQKEHAVLALIRMVTNEPNEYTIVSLGPLTNIALAIRLDPFFLSKVKNIVVMGGCLYAKGNSTRVTEYAFNFDPEAAHIVFTAAKQYSADYPNDTQPKLTLVPWEVSVEQGLDWKFYDYLINTPPINELTHLMKELNSIKEILFRKSHETIISRSVINTQKTNESNTTNTETSDENKNENSVSVVDPLSIEKPIYTSNAVLQYQINATKFIMSDLYTLVCALEPESVIKEYQDLDVDIELSGKYARGLTCIDWLGSGQRTLNARIILKVDKDIIKNILIQSFKVTPSTFIQKSPTASEPLIKRLKSKL
ncbi:nucleoside hydrolase [Piromyces finnis]|uniref:Nucleoside hydrolase n=1 Tax=Piromyces finnis TaxID=1754191 RepID=A0A1Y1V6P9_9FUNG|nr:nucleoside hydrolase [Piromyces finnis]|eukprot:ORX48132.1 nucleoside hydrolase [Piromyces finnis]